MLSIFSVAGITGGNNVHSNDRVGAPFQTYFRWWPEGGDAVPVVTFAAELVEQTIHYYHD